MSDYVGFGQCFLLVMLAICLPFALHMIGRLFDRGVTFFRSDGTYWGFCLGACEDEPQSDDGHCPSKGLRPGQGGSGTTPAPSRKGDQL